MPSPLLKGTGSYPSAKGGLFLLHKASSATWFPSLISAFVAMMLGFLIVFDGHSVSGYAAILGPEESHCLSCWASTSLFERSLTAHAPNGVPLNICPQICTGFCSQIWWRWERCKGRMYKGNSVLKDEFSMNLWILFQLFHRNALPLETKNEAPLGAVTLTNLIVIGL